MNMLEKAAIAAGEAYATHGQVGDLRAAIPPHATCLAMVRAALFAIREPSMAQLAAAQTAWNNDPEKKSSTIYRAMLDAILEDGESK